MKSNNQDNYVKVADQAPEIGNNGPENNFNDSSNSLSPQKAFQNQNKLQTIQENSNILQPNNLPYQPIKHNHKHIEVNDGPAQAHKTAPMPGKKTNQANFQFSSNDKIDHVTKEKDQVRSSMIERTYNISMNITGCIDESSNLGLFSSPAVSVAPILNKTNGLGKI